MPRVAAVSGMGDVPFPPAASTGTVLHSPSLGWEMAILAFNCVLACNEIAVNAQRFNILIL